MPYSLAVRQIACPRLVHAPRLVGVNRSRFYLWVLLSLAIPVQGIAAIAPQLACFESGSLTALLDPTQAVPALTMHCHDARPGEAASPPPCCGDSCPDMAGCAASLAAGVSSPALPAFDRRAVPDDRYLLPDLPARLSHPFRPPAVSL